MDKTNELFALFAQKQKHVWCCCPRCGTDRMNKDVAKNALSRRADIMICDICGNMEALEDIPGNYKIPLERWALYEHPERFFLKGKDYAWFCFTFGNWDGYPFKNAYILVEAFDAEDAKKRLDEWWPGEPSYERKYAFASCCTEESIRKSGAWQYMSYAGGLRLNGCFEHAE